MIDFFGNPIIEEEIMQHFDTRIRGGFGNTPAILEAAHADLAADNAAAAKAEYGRGPDIPLVTLESLVIARDYLHTLVENNDYSKTTLVDSVKAAYGRANSVIRNDLLKAINAMLCAGGWLYRIVENDRSEKNWAAINDWEDACKHLTGILNDQS